MEKIRKRLERSFVRQRDSTDCGPACLLSLLRYYGGDSSLEAIRESAGTANDGTTLLGLHQAAAKAGFTSAGCEASIDDLIHHAAPVILHVIVSGFQHYIICLVRSDGEFLVSDPASGLRVVSGRELNRIWVSKKCLTLYPNERFVSAIELRRSKWRWILRLVRDDYAILGVSVLLGGLIASLGVVMATYSQKLIDFILPSRDAHLLIVSVVLVFVLLLFQVFLQSARKLLLLYQSRGFNNRIIDAFYSSLLHLPKSFFDNRKIGELVARLNDTGRIQRVVTLILGGIFIDALTVLVILFFVFFYSWQVGVISSLTLPVYFLLVRSFNPKIMDAQRGVMRSYAHNESNFINTLQGVTVIKNRNKQSLFSKLSRDVYGIYQETAVELGRLNIKLGVYSGLFGVTFLMGILIVMAFDVFAGRMRIGEMMAVLGLMGLLLPAISNLAMVSIPINEAGVAFDRMFEFMNIPANRFARRDSDIFTLHELNVNNISFGFPGRRQILRDVSFYVRKGEVISLVGESGCGKSTIVQILQKFYLPDRGEIIVNKDRDLNSFQEERWFEVIGVVPQDIHIFNGTVLYNIGFASAEEESARIVQFCKERGFQRYIDLFPQGYDTIVGEEGINLSGGQKQIIGLARALIHNPQLLILDEATSSMDHITEKFVISLIRELSEKVAIILVSHRLEVVKTISKRVYAIENGKIINTGHCEDLTVNSNSPFF